MACDTPLPGRLEGELDLDWLEAQLDATRGRPVVIAMHHPPLLTGIPVLDAIGLPAEQRAAVAKLIARFPDVRRVVAGHVHRTAFALLGGCGVVTAPSTNLQARLEIGGQAFEFRPEPPGFCSTSSSAASSSHTCRRSLGTTEQRGPVRDGRGDRDRGDVLASTIATPAVHGSDLSRRRRSSC